MQVEPLNARREKPNQDDEDWKGLVEVRQRPRKP